MDIVWEKKKYFNKDTLKDCEKGAVVLLVRYRNFGPFLVVGCDNGSAEKILLFDFNDNIPSFFDADEHVEVLDAELHVY